MRRARPDSNRSAPTVRGNRGAGRGALRRGAVGSLDYVLVLGVIVPLVAIVMPLGRRILRLVYEMTLVLVSWPFL